MARQVYKTSGIEEYVIVGNDVLMRCNIPSFVADFVSVVSWEDSEGREFHAQSNHGKWCKEYFKDDRGKKLQPIEQNLVLASFSCCHICMLFHILVYAIQCFSVAGQDYRVTVHEESVILGNAALLKCYLPSFVADFLSVTAWVDSEGLTYHFGSGENLGNSRL